MKRRKKLQVEIIKGKVAPKKKLLKPHKTTDADKARKAKRTGYRFKTEQLKNKEVKALLFDEYLRETNNEKAGLQSLTKFLNKK